MFEDKPQVKPGATYKGVDSCSRSSRGQALRGNDMVLLERLGRKFVVEFFYGEAFGEYRMFLVGQDEPGLRFDGPGKQDVMEVAREETDGERNLVFFCPFVQLGFFDGGGIHSDHRDIAGIE